MKSKVPPQAIDIEKAILGAILIEKGALNTAEELVRPEMFYSTANQLIFTAIQRLSSRSQAIDFLTVSAELKALGQLETVGGEYYLMTLTNFVVSSAHLHNHCRIVAQRFMLRELIKIGGNLYSKGYDEMTDPFELVESTEKALHDLTLTLNSKDCISIDDTLIEIVKELEEKRNRDEYLTGISTGFASLDRHTCGWQPTDFNIFAARPKSGKTAFALNLAVNALLSGSGVCFFSMEMSARQLVKRILANKANMYLQALRDARLDDGQMSHLFEKGIKKLHGLPFYIDDTASLSVAEFKAKARRLIRKDGVKMLIIDYLQLMQPDKSKKGQNREQEISTIARQLKITAKELSVPIIALSQLSREVEKRGSHVPQLSDLRESGSLEQDADMVGFLYRPTEQEILEDAGKAETIYFKIAAYRNGDNKTFEYNFKGEYQRFEEVGEYTAKEAPVRAIKPKEDTFPGTRLYLHNRPTGTDDKDPF